MYYRSVLGWSVAVCILGNILYSCASLWGTYVLLAGRFTTGFGAGTSNLYRDYKLINMHHAGTLSVIRAYVAHVTTPKERTKYMSILGAVQFFGFAIMPGIYKNIIIIVTNLA